MKVIVTLLFCAIATHATLFERQQYQCLTELKLDVDVINTIDKDSEVSLPNPDYGKLKACVYTKKGFLTRRGRILWETAQNTIIEALMRACETTKNYSEKTVAAEVRQIIKVCKRQNFVVDDIGEVAIKFRNCLLSSELSRTAYYGPKIQTASTSTPLPTTEQEAVLASSTPQTAESSPEPILEVASESSSLLGTSSTAAK